MSYTIYNTDGTTLLTLGDGKIDQLTTSLTLIGKNVNSYGEYLNNNLIRLLENFANTIEPNSPVVGQLWYDITTGRLKIYDLTQTFRPVTSNIVSDALPTNLVDGDTWFDSTNNQLYVTPDGQTLYLIGPQNSSVYGTTGLIVDTPTDSSSNTKTVTSLFSGGRRIGIVSENNFTLSATSATMLGFSSLAVGINLDTSIPGIRFVGTATSSDSLQGLNINDFIRKGINEATTGTLTIANDNGLVVENSAYEALAIYVDIGTHVGTIAYNAVNKDMQLQVSNQDTGLSTALYATGLTKNLGVWNTNPQFPLDVQGDTRINGNLYVVGTATNIESVNLQINDNNIELGYSHNTDTYASGGGIILHGNTQHTITWINDGTGWNFNDNVNLSAGSSYRINSYEVIGPSYLGRYITDAPGLVRLGTLSYLTITNVLISGSTVGVTGTNQTLHLSANGTGTVDVSNLRITSVSTATDRLDATNKGYVDDAIGRARYSNSFALTLDVTNHQGDNNYVKTYLDLMFPIVNDGTNGTTSTDYLLNIPQGSRAKILCGVTTIPTTTATVYSNFSTIKVDKDGVFSTATVVAGLPGSIVTQIPATAYTPITTYTVQTWYVSPSLVWTGPY